MKNFCMLAAATLSILSTAAMAADTGNLTTGTPPAPPAVSGTITPAPQPAAHAPAPTTTTSTTPTKTTAPAATPNATTSATPPTTTPAAHPHHHHTDPTTATTSTPSAVINTQTAPAGTHHGRRAVDSRGNVSYICGEQPTFNAHGALTNGSFTTCSTDTVVSPYDGTTVILSSYPPAIISNGIITYPAGTMYQDTSGQWQSCPGLLRIDARHITTCEQPPAAVTSEAPATTTDQPAIPAPTSSLTSDSKSGLRSDKNMY